MIPRWKVRAALRLLGLEDSLTAQSIELRIDKGYVAVFRPRASLRPISYMPITDEAEDARLHLFAMLPGQDYSEMFQVDEDELKYFTGPKLAPDGLTTYPNSTMVLTVKRRPE